MSHFADRLLDAIAAKGSPAAVALDPVYTQLPGTLRRAGATVAEELDAIERFSRRVIDLIAPIVPVVKINSAYFERYHADGIRVFDALIVAARNHGMVVISDVKRGDVGHTAEMYAVAHVPDADAITISGYFGLDGVRPFIETAAKQGKGIFVLVRTSNPSASDLQDAMLADGRKVHEIVAQQVAAWASDPHTIGQRGFSLIGAVAATREPADAAKLRSLMPHSILLVPGYGAQGGRADDFRPYFHPDGSGALVVAGRSVIYAFERAQSGPCSDWEAAIVAACRSFVGDFKAFCSAN